MIYSGIHINIALRPGNIHSPQLHAALLESFRLRSLTRRRQQTWNQDRSYRGKPRVSCRHFFQVFFLQKRKQGSKTLHVSRFGFFWSLYGIYIYYTWIYIPIYLYIHICGPFLIRADWFMVSSIIKYEEKGPCKPDLKAPKKTSRDFPWRVFP